MTKELSPLVWFGTRQVTPAPRHFTKVNTPVTDEANLWVLTKLNGRYSLVEHADVNENPFSLSSIDSYFYFEDPKEAMLYELRWSGN